MQIVSAYRNLRSTADAGRRFKCYYYYIIAVIALISISIVTLVVVLLKSEITFISFASATLLVLPAVADISLLVWTTIKVLKLSWSTNITDHHWFEKEKNRWVKTLIKLLIRSTELKFIL